MARRRYGYSYSREEGPPPIYIYGARRRPARVEDQLPCLLGEDAVARDLGCCSFALLCTVNERVLA
ncbi:hypothetical protein Dimus_036486, partial [Dionaea muscipula]